MNWNNLLTGPLKGVLTDLEEAFYHSGIDYYIIGAQARDIWLGRPGKGYSETKDLDLAIQVGNKEEYEGVKRYLVDHKGFSPQRENYFSLRSFSGVIVDILPFGGMNFDEPVTATAVTSLPVNALEEVYRHGITAIDGKRTTGFKVATLPSIFLLKLIAYDDRPEIRLKDVGDIVHIIRQYASIEGDFIYEYHNDLFDPERTPIQWFDNSELSSIVMGREIVRIIGGNPVLQERVKKIIRYLISENANSSFVREMSRISSLPISVMLSWLTLIEHGFMGPALKGTMPTSY